MKEIASKILTNENWLYFKIYKDPKEPLHWKSNLDWYHRVLREIVKPIVERIYWE